MGRTLVAALVVVWVSLFVAGCGDNWLVDGENDPQEDVTGIGGDEPGIEHSDSVVVDLDAIATKNILAIGETADVTAIGTASGGSRWDLTHKVEWTSSDESVATVAHGVVTGMKPGQVMITAEYEGMTGSVAFSVHSAGSSVVALSVAAPNPTLPAGTSMQLSATAIYGDGSHADVTGQATWTVAGQSFATVSNSGMATGVAVGAALATASYQGMSGTLPLVVTTASFSHIEIDPAMISVAAGFSTQAHATAVYSDGSTVDVTALAQWSATPTTVATAAFGVVTGKMVGSASVTATFNGSAAVAQVDVTAATLVSIELNPAVLAISVGGGDVSLTATGVFSDGSKHDITTQATWSSAALGVATVDKGVVHSESVGVAVVTAAMSGKSGSVIVTITAAQLTQIQVPGMLTIPAGRWIDVNPIGILTDGLTTALGLNVTFTSSDSTIASVSANGRITANAPGDVIITVKSGLITAAIHVTVSAALLQGIAVTPVVAVVTRGATVQMKAEATYSDGSVVDVTSQGAWASSAPAVASVSNAAATKGQVSGVAVGVSTVSVTVDGVTGTSVVTVSPAILDDLIVTPPALVLARGFAADIIAIGHYSDDSTLDLTTQVTWTSSNPAVATVSNSLGLFGHVTAVAPGTATITATKGSASKTVSVTVTPAILDHIELPTATLNVPRGLTVPVIAIGVYSDDSHVDITNQISWSSSNPSIASVSNILGSIGLVKGEGVGDAIITATYSGKTQTIPVHVTAALLSSITLPTITQTVPRGLTLPIIATGVYSDGSTVDITTSVTWSSSAPAIASVSNLLGTIGLVTGNSVGDATLTASYQGKTATVPVHVTAAILSSITLPTTPVNVPRGLTLPLVATGVYSDGSLVDLTSSVTWSSSAPSIATVSSLLLNAGLVTGVNVGDATVTATVNGKSATITVHVTASILGVLQTSTSSATVPRGLTLPVFASGVYSDGTISDLTSSATWTSSAPMIASVSNAAGSVGLVTGLSVGDAVLTASMGGKTATVTVHVTAAVLSSITLPTMTQTVPRGLTLPVIATGVYSDGSFADLTSQVTWTSANPGVATVSGLVASAGLVTGVSVGDTTITASLNGKTATVPVHITAALLSAIQLPNVAQTVPRGLTLPIVATGMYTDGALADLTATVTWTSSNPSVATVSGLAVSAGLVTGVSVGDATITASYNGQTANVVVHVTAAVLSGITLPTMTQNVPRGLTLPIIATGVFSDGSLADITASVTWSSSAPTIASVSNLAGAIGVVTGVAVGDATITATYNGKSSTMPVHVSSAILSSISLPTATQNVPKGLTLPIIATGVFSDGSLADLTATVTWSSSATSVATVSGLVGSAGLVTGVAVGDATITASYNGKTATVPVHVTSALLSGLQLPNITLNIPKGLSVPVIVTGLYTDGTTVDLTTSVTWTSSAPMTASVSTLVATAGLVTGVSVGDATITATYGTQTVSMPVHVSNSILSSISLPTVTQNVPKGLTLPIIATGLYSDGSTADLTSSVTWSTSASSIATVSGLVGSAGLVTGVAVGDATITATINGKSASVPVHVSAALLSSITLPTVTQIVPRGLTLPVIATGVYSDGSIADLTSTVTWTSNAPTIASVSSLIGSAGLVTGVSVGSTTLTASYGGQSSTVTVQVTAAILSSITLPTVTQNVPKGLTLPIIATGVYSDGSTVDLTSQATWSSSAPTVATVSGVIGSIGLVTGVAVGDTTITASFGGKTATVPVHVSNAILSGITLPALPVTVAKGLIAPVIATGTYSDGSLADLTATVTWSSAAPSIATVSSLIGTAGIVTGVSVGSTTVTATYGGKSASIAVTVTQPLLQSIDVLGPTALGIFQVGSVSAKGHYSDGSVADLTSQVTFASSNILAATVSSAGSLLGLALGDTTITATLGGITGSTAIGVGAGGCHVVINEVKAGTLLVSGDDWVELYNPCSYTISLSTMKLVYRTAIAVDDTALVTLTGSIGPGEYRLYASTASPVTGTRDGSFSLDIGGLLGGGIGLRGIEDGSLVDSIAWGVAANGFNEGTVLLGAITLGSSLARIPNGRDTNNNLADFSLLTTQTPRAAN